MFAWQFAKACYSADHHGWTRFISMQNHLNLLKREEEREMLPLCEDMRVGVIPWSPLARGRMTWDWDDKTEHSESDQFGTQLYDATVAADRKVVEAVASNTNYRGVPRAQVALAWVLQKEEVTAPIIGATKEQHLSDAVAALALELSTDEVTKLEAKYIPHSVVGYV
jgi:aryl-alcohol dehydrogenase-like predicted oxidoreductase